MKTREDDISCYPDTPLIGIQVLSIGWDTKDPNPLPSKNNILIDSVHTKMHGLFHMNMASLVFHTQRYCTSFDFEGRTLQ